MSKQGLGMPCTGKSTGLGPRSSQMSRDCGEVEKTEADLVGCRSGSCELLFRDNARRTDRKCFLSSLEEDWE